MSRIPRLIVLFSTITLLLVTAASGGRGPGLFLGWPFFPSLSTAIIHGQGQADLAKPLTLAACLREALARNLDLSVDAVAPALDDAAVAETREKSLPQFNMAYDRQDTTALGTWGLQGTNIRSKYDFASAGLTQKVITGADVALTFSNSMSDTSQAYTVINPSYYSVLRFELKQPLLKGFGPKINRIETTRAENSRDAGLAQLKVAVLQTVYDVEEAYWNLLYAQENLKVQESSLAQSRETLKRNNEAARIGSKSAIEVLSAETEVTRWEDGAISARLQVERLEEQLRRLMNSGTAAGELGEGREDAAQSRLLLADRPIAEKRTVALDEALRTALAERPEILSAEKDLQTSANDVGYYRNQLLPQLDLDFSIWNPGQSGVKFLYLNNDPLSQIVIGKIVGSRIDSLNDMFRKYYRNWSLNLNLSVPLANIFSRASLTRANLNRQQSELKLERQKRAIASEVSAAVLDLRNKERRIKSSADYRAMVEKRLAAEQQRYDLGLVGSEWLFSYQRDLAQARTDEVQAQVDYKIALAKLDKVMGTTLKTKGLTFRNFAF
jgi:outer membrane protein TolC